MPLPFKFELGEVLKDIVTGFKGVVMSRIQYFTDCNHYGLLSRKLSKGDKPGEWVYFDETRLIRAKEKKVVLGKRQNPTSGLMPDPPEM